MTGARARSVLAFVAALALAGCGGGGGGSEPAAAESATSYPLLASYKAHTAAGSTTRYAVSGNCSGTATFTDSPAVAADFEGVAGYSTTSTLTISLTNCSPASMVSTSVDYYDANYTPLGSNTPGEEYARFQTLPAPLPATVKVGDSAVFGTLQLYTDATKRSSVGTRVLSYVVEADAGTSAIVNLVSKEYDTSNRLQYTQQNRMRITGGGLVTPVSIDVQSATTDVHLLLTAM